MTMYIEKELCPLHLSHPHEEKGESIPKTNKQTKPVPEHPMQS